MSRTRVDFASFLRSLWRDRWLIATVAAMAGALSIAYALTRQPLYESEALVASSRDSSMDLASLSGMLGQFSALTGALGLPFGMSSSVDETVAVMKSRDFTARFLREHQILPHLYPDLWDARQGRWKAGAGQGGLGERWANFVRGITGESAATGTATGGVPGEPSMERALERFDKMRTIAIDRRTSFVRVAVRGPSPKLANQWAAAMILDVNRELRERTLQESRRAVELLTDRVENSQYSSIRVTAANLLESNLRREIVAQSRDDYALRVLDPPSMPELRYSPRRTRMVILGGLAGLLLGVMVSISRRAYTTYRQRSVPSK